MVSKGQGAGPLRRALRDCEGAEAERAAAYLKPSGSKSALRPTYTSGFIADKVSSKLLNGRQKPMAMVFTKQ